MGLHVQKHVDPEPGPTAIQAHAAVKQSTTQENSGAGGHQQILPGAKC